MRALAEPKKARSKSLEGCSNLTVLYEIIDKLLKILYLYSSGGIPSRKAQKGRSSLNKFMSLIYMALKI